MNNSLNKKREYIIHIDLEGKEDLYDEYNWNILNDKLAKYIDKQVSKSKFENKIIIEINIGTKDEIDKEKMSKCILEYYSDILAEMRVYEKLSLTRDFLLFTLGVFFLLISNGLQILHISLLTELLNIAGWVAIWEVIYNRLFVLNERKFKKKRAKQILKSEIVFK